MRGFFLKASEMKRSFKYGTASVLFLGAVCMVILTMQTDIKYISELPAYGNLRNADILLLGSSTWRGRLLKMLDRQSDYLHVGMIDLCNGDTYLIHADPQHGCVVRDCLSEYLESNKVERALLLRVQCEEELSEMAIAFAREQSLANRKFDNAFRYGEGNGFYCTELVLLAWNAANIELLPDVRTGDRVFPSRLLESKFVCPAFKQ